MTNLDTQLDRLGDALHRAAVADLDAAASAEAQVAPPFWRRRGPRLALGGAVALASVTAALVVSAGGDNTPAAYAVEPQEGGGVEIKVYNLSEPEGVEQAFEEAGVPAQVNYLEAGMTCREPHFTPSTVEGPMLGNTRPIEGINFATLPDPNTGTARPMTIGIGTVQQQREMSEDPSQGDQSPAELPPGFVIDPTTLRPDQTLILSGAPVGPGSHLADSGVDVAGATEVQVRVAEGTVEPCEPVPISD